MFVIEKIGENCIPGRINTPLLPNRDRYRCLRCKERYGIVDALENYVQFHPRVFPDIVAAHRLGHLARSGPCLSDAPADPAYRRNCPLRDSCNPLTAALSSGMGTTEISFRMETTEISFPVELDVHFGRRTLFDGVTGSNFFFHGGAADRSRVHLLLRSLPDLQNLAGGRGKTPLSGLCNLGRKRMDRLDHCFITQGDGHVSVEGCFILSYIPSRHDR